MRVHRAISTTMTALAGAMLLGLAGGAAAQDRVTFNMASTYGSSLTQLGTLGKRIQQQLDAVSGGNITLRFQEPGALVPALEVFESVQTGAVESGWSTGGYWVGRKSALALFSAVPFGPRASEYIAWYYFGGGQALYEEIYAEFDIHPVICGIIAPEASGWFREPIESIEDLRGLKMRFFGLGARVMEKMGVSTQLLAGGDIFPALELGTIDATEFSMPAIDLKLGFHQVAKHYYFPGWHQQSTLFELIINKDEWEGLSAQQQAQINIVCGDSVRHGLAEGEAIQFAALKELQEEHGVTIHRWSDEILDTLEAAWLEVVEELKEDEDFNRVWASLSEFRTNYKVWSDLGYLNR